MRILDAPTGFARMRALLRLAKLDDSVLAPWMQPEGDQVRVVCDLEGLGYNPFVCLGEWSSLQALISIVRSVAGPRWCPPELTFVGRQPPSSAAQEAFANTRFLVGQPHTSMLVEGELLARPGLAGVGGAPGRSSRPGSADDEVSGWTFPSALRSAIRPYLSDGYPALGLMAETLGLSGRTLQRRLQRCGRTYSEIVQGARFDLAREMLVDPSVKVIDVAMAAGYETPQHFARAFRRLAGVSPTTYRQSAAGSLEPLAAALGGGPLPVSWPENLDTGSPRPAAKG